METYLIHHGIKGQRWGIRRYQNPDGTLTNAGKKRALNKEAKAYRKELKKDFNFSSKLARTEAREWKKEQIQDRDIKTGLSDKQKKALKIGAIAVGSSLAIYGTYKVSKYLNNNKTALQAGKNYSQNSSFDVKEMIRKMNETATGNFDSSPSKNKSSVKPLSSFEFDTYLRRKADGSTDSIDLPRDRKGYADSFAKQMVAKSGKSKDYNYYYDYIMSRMR